MAFVATDSNLSMWAENGSGDYSIQGTDSDLNSIRETMGDSSRMQGVYRSDVAVETNAPPLVPDNGESITITWIALSFVPEEVKMAS